MAQDVSTDVNALVRDLLPILVPGATFDDETGSVLLPVPDGRARVSTQSLIEACRAEPNHLWPRTVDAWLTALKGEVASAVGSDETVTTEQLRVQVTPNVDEDFAAKYVVLPFGDHFDATVLVDFPTRMRPLSRAELEPLGLDLEQCINLAIRQTVQNELRVAAVQDSDVAGSALRMIAKDGSPYVSSALLSITRFAPGDIEAGVLVAVPRYSTVLLHRVESAESLQFVPYLAELVIRMYGDAADRCTDKIYWWVDGTFHPIRIEFGDDPTAPRLTLPEALHDLVRRLQSAAQ